jgi:8-oxo-dGTP pyrophosphatase MutT (NUDIX family)
MKIFLNDRIIEFLSLPPENLQATDFLLHYQSIETLREAWTDFERYEKFRKLFIIEPGFVNDSNSVAFSAFSSFFKFIPAAGGLVRNEKGAFLFIHRLGFWDLPKGKVDKKDIPGPEYSIRDIKSAYNAAIREVKEETGLKSVEICNTLPATWHIYIAKDKYVLKKTQWFDMKADSGQVLKPETSEGIFLVKWTSPDAIHCVLSHTYASIRDLLVDIIF